MPRFCVNTNARLTGEHEVHNLDAGCGHLPELQDQYQLGYFATCVGAVVVARQVYPDVDGCAYCTPECHHKIDPSGVATLRTPVSD